jgi:predicted ATPase
MLASELARLGLTWKVQARRVNDAAVELLVGRMPQAQQGGAQDMVSVADVGFGVSQTLPVVVALLVAAPGQIVYLEQPEIHLHPRAQVQLAKTLVQASKRGVKVIAETHSSLLIRAIQTEIATGAIASEDVSMNWFSRDEQSGFTKVDVADLDDKGRFGDWPLDLDEISQDADLAYIDAISGSR